MSPTLPTLILRPARSDELEALTCLCLRSKAVWGYEPAFIDACRAELTLTDDDLRTTKVAVAERDRVLAGVAQVAIDGRDAHLEKLFVEPTQLRAGAGRTLFEWATKTARALGAMSLIVEADPEAAPFYRRMGARDAGFAPSGSIRGRVLPRLIVDFVHAATAS